MQRRFEGKTAIVTGAGRGIGEAIAERLADEGAEVLVVGRTPQPLAETVASIERAGGKAFAHAADVSSMEDIDGMVDAALNRWSTIDFLVNNAAVLDEPPFFDISMETFRKTLDINMTGLFFTSQRVARVMADNGGGSIVHISSIDSLGADGPYSAYTATKCGVVSLARTMARELAPFGIRVNCVAPGVVATDMTRQCVPQHLWDYMSKEFDRVPLRRFVDPPEIAGAVAFMLSDDASAVTGTQLLVDCGLTSNLYIEETMPEPFTSIGD